MQFIKKTIPFLSLLTVLFFSPYLHAQTLTKSKIINAIVGDLNKDKPLIPPFLMWCEVPSEAGDKEYKRVRSRRRRLRCWRRLARQCTTRFSMWDVMMKIIVSGSWRKLSPESYRGASWSTRPVGDPICAVTA